MHTDTPGSTPYSFGSWRPFGTYAMAWHFIQPTRGSYAGTGSDRALMQLTWTAADALVASCQTRGIEIVFPLWLTPVWAGTAPASGNLTLGATGGNGVSATSSVAAFTAGDVGKAISTGEGQGTIMTFNSTTNVLINITDPFATTGYANGLWYVATRGPWTVAGESSPVTNLQFVRDFIIELLTHYNLPSVTNPTGIRKIKRIELRNEPFPANIGWTGTQEQLVDECYAVYSAAKATDPRVTIVAPPFYSSADQLTFLNTLGTSSGRRGYETFDELCIHQYGQKPNKVLGGNDLYWDSAVGIKQALTNLAAVAPTLTKSVVGTEWGLTETEGGADTLAFAALTAAQRKLYIQRILVMAALNGMPLFCIFNNGTLAGDYTNDTTGVIAAVTDIHTKLSGQRIISGGFSSFDGSVTVTLGTGVTYTF